MSPKARVDAEALDIRGTRYHELRYEALVNEPECVMREVLAFIHAPWDPAAARFAGSPGDFDKVLSATGKASTTLDQLRKPLYSDKIGAWSHIVSSQQIEAVRQGVRARGFGEMFAADEAASGR